MGVNHMQSLNYIAARCINLIKRAENDGIVIDDGNVVDLIADNLTTVPLSDIRAALVVAGLAARFPKATNENT